MLTHTIPQRAKPGPLLPTLLERIPYDVLSRCRMSTGQGDGGAGSGAGDGGKPDADKTFSQAQLDQVIAERLTRERAKYADYDALKASKDELDRLKAEGQTDHDKALAKAAKDAEDAARSDERTKADTRVLRAEVKAAAGAKFADPGDALRLVDLTGLRVADDGSVDDAAIRARLDQLLKDKPYLAASGGGNGSAGGLGNLGQGQRQQAGNLTGREQGLAEAERRFGTKQGT